MTILLFAGGQKVSDDRRISHQTDKRRQNLERTKAIYSANGGESSRFCGSGSRVSVPTMFTGSCSDDKRRVPSHVDPSTAVVLKKVSL